MRRALACLMLLWLSGCMRVRDGWLGSDEPNADAGASDAGDASPAEPPEDDPEDEEEEGDDDEESMPQTGESSR